MIKFEVGKSYECTDSGFDPITVIRRTPKMIVVKNSSGDQWRMLIRVRSGKQGITEYCIDSSYPKGWRHVFEYSAEWET